MQKISTHLWFDREAKEAAAFYVQTFGDATISSTVTIHDTPSGDADIVTMQILGNKFTLISAGPYFKMNPAISFFVACESKEEVDAIWTKLMQGGRALMDVGSYPFSERYGWAEDKYGVSWQIMYMNGQPVTQRIIPMLMFVGAVCGKAEEAMQFYTSIFHNASVNFTMRYGAGEEPDKEGTIKHGGFVLEGQQFAAMDSAHKHEFSFNEAVSFVVHCDTQEEIDYYWEKLSAVPEAEQCGWLKDIYGLSWQIVPTVMDELLGSGSDEQRARVTQAFLQMKKFNIAKLRAAAQ